MAYTEIKFGIHQLGFKTRLYDNKVEQFIKLMNDVKELESFISWKRINATIEVEDFRDLEVIYNDLVIQKLKWLSNLEPVFRYLNGYDSIYRNTGWTDDPTFELVQTFNGKSEGELDEMIKAWDSHPVEGSAANCENYAITMPRSIPGSNIIVKNYTISSFPGKSRIEFVNVDYKDDDLKY